MEFLKIVGLGVLAAVSYGIIHDQITARVCVEYFTIGHPPLIPSTSPTLLAFAWGVVATWWVGLPLGFTLASAARLGHRPKLLAAQLTPLISPPPCYNGRRRTRCGNRWLHSREARGHIAPWNWATMIPAPAQPRFLADAWAHSASYLSGVVGGLVIVVIAYRRRGTMVKGAA